MNTNYPKRFFLCFVLLALACVPTAYAIYNPTAGRWLSRDPLEDKAGAYQYGFVFNSPPNATDWLGLAVNAPPPIFGTCRPCCCCVDSLAIANLTGVYNAHLPGHFGRWFGHEFDVVATLSYKRSAIRQSCLMVWRERASRDAIPPAVDNQWDDIFTIVPTCMQKQQWDSRREPCPGTEVISVHDPPAYQVPLQGTQNLVRTLEFEITVYSSSFCPCAVPSKTVRATQVLTFVGGQGVALLSPFIIHQ